MYTIVHIGGSLNFAISYLATNFALLYANEVRMYILIEFNLVGGSINLWNKASLAPTGRKVLHL